MSRRSLGTLVALILLPIGVIPPLANLAVSTRRVEVIPDFVLASTRGTSTGFNANANVS